MINKVTLMGRISQIDVSDGLLKFNLTTSERYIKSGQWIEHHDVHAVEYVGDNARQVGESLRTGEMIHVGGKSLSRKLNIGSHKYIKCFGADLKKTGD